MIPYGEERHSGYRMTSWKKVGVAWINKDQSITLAIDLMPRDPEAKFQLRVPEDSDQLLDNLYG